MLDYRTDEEGDGGLAVCAGNGEVCQFIGRITRGGLREQARGLCSIVNDYCFVCRMLYPDVHRDFATLNVILRGGLADDVFGAVGDGLVDEIVPVADSAGDSDKYIALFDKSRIDANLRPVPALVAVIRRHSAY
jgi:hypothetical protein